MTTPLPAWWASAVSRNVHRVLAGPDDASRRCRPREDARYELRAAPCETPPGSRDHPGNVPGHRTSRAVGFAGLAIPTGKRRTRHRREFLAELYGMDHPQQLDISNSAQARMPNRVRAERLGVVAAPPTPRVPVPRMLCLVVTPAGWLYEVVSRRLNGSGQSTPRSLRGTLTPRISPAHPLPASKADVPLRGTGVWWPRRCRSQAAWTTVGEAAIRRTPTQKARRCSPQARPAPPAPR